LVTRWLDWRLSCRSDRDLLNALAGAGLTATVVSPPLVSRSYAYLMVDVRHPGTSTASGSASARASGVQAIFASERGESAVDEVGLAGVFPSPYIANLLGTETA
jgi:hypothetical protein